jgi:hypothetical protein
MPQYTVAPVADAGTIDPAVILAELEKIAAAFNTHESGDFAADCIPLAALQNQKSIFTVNFELEIGPAGAVVIGTIQKLLVIPFDCTLVDLRVIAASVTNHNETTKLYHETDAVDICSEVTLADDATAYQETPTKTDFTAGDVISLRVSQDAGATISGLQWTMAIKADHTD